MPTLLKSHQPSKYPDVFNLLPLRRGAFAQVYSASYQGRDVAVKVMFIDRRFMSQDTDEKLQANLSHEIIVMSQLLRHQNIVQYIMPLADGLIMELINGMQLKDRLEENPPPDYETRLRYQVQLLAALKWMHQKNWIHCDLKTENVLVQKDNVLKLCDFGLAINVANKATVTSLSGATIYKAPELLLKQQASKASDVYAAALMLWEIHACQNLWPWMRNTNDFRRFIETKQRPNFAGTINKNTALALLTFTMWREKPADRIGVADALYQLKKIETRQRNAIIRSQSIIWEIEENGLFSNPQACLVSAIQDENKEILSSLLTDPEFKSTWITQCILNEKQQWVAPMLEGIRSGNASIALLLFNHFMSDVNLNLDDHKRFYFLEDSLSQGGILMNAVAKGMGELVTLTLRNHRHVNTLFASLFAKEGIDMGWMKWVMLSHDELVARIETINIILSHPLFTIKHLQQIVEQADKKEVPSSSLLFAHPFYKLWATLKTAAVKCAGLQDLLDQSDDCNYANLIEKVRVFNTQIRTPGMQNNYQ